MLHLKKNSILSPRSIIGSCIATDLQLQCYSAAGMESYGAAVLQCYDAAVSWCCSTMMLQCYGASVAWF